jgi:N-acetylmuramoyl-L-alanine amidase
MVPIFGILILYFLSSGAIPVFAKQPLFDAYRRIIVLDPGHGGREFGARGADGTSEKAVALELAKLIDAELQQEYKVTLTRTDDYHVVLDNRTALANHLGSMNSIPKGRIQGTPLAVLQGAHMPAILIEVGYLTNPAEEKNLRNDRFLADLAAEISRGIEDFLSRTDQ